MARGITDLFNYELARAIKKFATGFVQSVSAGFGIIITGTAQNPVINVDPAVIATATKNYTSNGAVATVGILAVYIKTDGTIDVPDNSQTQMDGVFGLAVGPWGAAAQVAVARTGQTRSGVIGKTGKVYALPGGALGNLADLTPGDYTKVVGLATTTAVEVLCAADSYLV